MSSLGAIPGTGPATNPLPILSKSRRRGFSDLPTDRTLVMGIINVTPDSFSDGGDFANPDDAIKYGMELMKQGADIIDVGGESTAPGREPITAEEEKKRILPVVEALAKLGAVVSLDTMHADVAAEAMALGSIIINDVSGVNVTDEMVELVANSKAHYVIMHNRGDAQTMDSLAHYEDVVEDVLAEITQIRDKFLAAGASAEQLIIDPGLGFSKKSRHNWMLLNELERFKELGHRVLIAASRKRFLGKMLDKAGLPSEPKQRDAATTAVSTLASAGGAWAVRVHDVPSTVAAVQVTQRWTGSN